MNGFRREISSARLLKAAKVTKAKTMVKFHSHHSLLLGCVCALVVPSLLLYCNFSKLYIATATHSYLENITWIGAQVKKTVTNDQVQKSLKSIFRANITPESDASTRTKLLNFAKTINRDTTLRSLVSEESCAPLKHVQLVNASNDTTMTYRYPAHQAYFFDDAPLAQCTQSTELFIAIKSSFRNFDRRTRCRRTWLSGATCDMQDGVSSQLCRWAMRRTAYAFFVSTPADMSPEQANQLIEHGDVVQLSLVEHYHNLTLKTVSAMYWAVSRCPSVKYVLTTDDDGILNVTNVWRAIVTFSLNQDRLEKFEIGNSGDLVSADVTYKIVRNIGHAAHYKRLFCGFLVHTPGVPRSSTYYTPTSVYAPSHFPDHLSGFFTLMSVEVADMIVRVAMCIEQFWIDDVYIGGMIPEFLGVRRLGIQNFKSVKSFSDEDKAAHIGLKLEN